MSRGSTNPAELDGWVKSTDPNTGRAFYANHITRVTQWEPPSNWVEPGQAPPPPPPPPVQQEQWEVMKDPSTGREFYVDHVRQITTWTKPAALQQQQQQQQRRYPSSTTEISSYPYGGHASTGNIGATSGASNPFRAAIHNRSHSISSITSNSTTKSNRKTTYQARKSWQDNAAFYQPTPIQAHEVDFSDSMPMPSPGFRVKKVSDNLRLTCPSCDTPFTLSKRRHHCRLCGDVFCHDCSDNRATLPLEGPEFAKPVRICDSCEPDVANGNFFSMRRYLTPLYLYNPGSTSADEEGDDSVASVQSVDAALASLTSDLESMLSHSSEFAAKMTIPPKVLVPNITKHLQTPENAGRAVRCLAALLAVASIVGNKELPHAVYTYGKGVETFSNIMKLLERSGSDRKTLYIQEEAARTVFYLTEPAVLSGLEAHVSQLESTYPDLDYGSAMDALDLPRTMRAMLDHSSNTKNPNLQRWAASSIRNLVKEDERRTTVSCNDAAALMASGMELPQQVYNSFLPELISTGGIMILCSLMGATDSDTRAHATGALSAILQATRTMDSSLMTLFEMTGGQMGSQESKDGHIVRAIVQGGGCGNSLAQLVLSADNSVARMGIEFCATLVSILVQDPRGTATLPEGYDCATDTMSELGACREAALGIANGPCLPALLSIMRDAELGGYRSGSQRPMELKQLTMETLAATVLAVSEMAKAASPSNTSVGQAVMALNEEGVVPVMLAILDSSSSQTLSRHGDSPSARIREAAGICLASMAVCSGDAMEELQSCHAISAMLHTMNDGAAKSTMRGDGAPRNLGMLQTVAALLTFSQHDSSLSQSDKVDQLLECIDAGAISTLSKILFAKMDWSSSSSGGNATVVGAMKARDACCRMLTAMFSIAETDDLAHQRLWEVMDADAYERNPPRTIVTAVLGVLQLAAGHARNAIMGGGPAAGQHYQAALMDLVESSLYAVGSMCGSNVVPGLEHTVKLQQLVEAAAEVTDKNKSNFAARRKEACAIACDILVHRSSRSAAQQQPLLPTMLVGGFGEGTLTSSLRLALAIARNGGMEQHAKMAASGILVPITDSLRSALSQNDMFQFSACLALVKFCGPHVPAGHLRSVQEAIRVATGVLTLPVQQGYHQASPEQMETTENLKASCISTLEALSTNASLWSSISKDALPSIVTYLHHTTSLMDDESAPRKKTLCAALRAVIQIIQQRSHAVAAARAGLAEPLAILLAQGTTSTTFEGISKSKDKGNDDEELPVLLALEVLHVMANNAEARRAASFLQCGVIEGVCCALAKSATDNPRKPTDGRADVAYWGLGILHLFWKDVVGQSLSMVLQQQAQRMVVESLVETIAREPNLIRALCSTFMLKTDMKFPQLADDAGKTLLDIPKLYGPPLVLVQESCAGYADTHTAALNLFFDVAVVSCALETGASDSIWNHILMRNPLSDAADEATNRRRLAAIFCAHLLRTLLDDNEECPFVPTDTAKRHEFETIAKPLIRHQLLAGLKQSVQEQQQEQEAMENSYLISVLVAFEVPRVCLSVWQDPALIDVAFELIKLMVDSHHDDLVHIFIESKPTLLSLFGLLNADASASEGVHGAEEIRRVVASILGTLAENGMLTKAVEKFGVRSSAIAALASACLADEATVAASYDHDDDDDEQLATSATMSSRCMQCLVELLEGGGKEMELSSEEAEAIAARLGAKICHMVISRFLERAKLNQYDVEDDEDVMEAPDVKMLCSVAQHGGALRIIASIGGLHALSLIAAEGQLSAVIALKRACEEDSSILIDVDGHVSVMKLISPDQDHSAIAWRDEAARRKIETAVFELLTDLCDTAKGRKAVVSANQCSDCIAYAAHVIGELVEEESPPEEAKTTEVEPPELDEDAFEEDSNAEKEAVTDDDDDDKADTEETTEDTETRKEVDPPKQDVRLKRKEMVREPTLESAALSFLAKIVGIEVCRQTLVENDRFVATLSLLAKDSTSFDLQLQTCAFLAQLSPFAVFEVGRKGTVSTSELAEAFTQVLQSSPLLPAHAKTRTGAAKLKNANYLKSMAAEGLAMVFHDCPESHQVNAMTHVITSWASVVKKNTIQRNIGTEIDRANSALLAYNLISLIVSSAGKESLRNMLSTLDLVKSMIYLTEWRYDSKAATGASSSEMEMMYWDAAVSLAIQHVANVVCSTQESHKIIVGGDGSIKTLLTTTILTMARPGRAPRKTCDYLTALRRVIEAAKNPSANRDACGAAAAKRILSRVRDC